MKLIVSKIKNKYLVELKAESKQECKKVDLIKIQNGFSDSTGKVPKTHLKTYVGDIEDSYGKKIWLGK